MKEIKWNDLNYNWRPYDYWDLEIECESCQAELYINSDRQKILICPKCKTKHTIERGIVKFIRIGAV